MLEPPPITQPTDTVADALGRCIEKLREHAAVRAGAGDRAATAATFDLIEQVAHLRQRHLDGATIRKPRTRKEAV